MVAFARVTAKESQLFSKLHKQGMGVKKIRAITGRSTDTISKHVFRKNTWRKKLGRPCVITDQVMKRLKTLHAKMTASANGKHEITVTMLKERMGLACSTKTILNAMHREGVYFRPLYEKPDLSKDDKDARLDFANAHAHRSPGQWAKYVHAVIDNKVFQVYTNGKARDAAARRGVRGVFRTRSRCYTSGTTRASRSLKQNTGAKSVMITCAIGAGRVLMWHVVNGPWNASNAAAMYTGPLRKSLRQAHPTVRGAWRVVEDNDPGGYKSGGGKRAKAEAGIEALSLPPRSPDLNPLDFSVWAEINRRMRRQEASWPKSKRESRDEFLARLRRTAMRLPRSYINAVMANMAKRVALLRLAKGGHFPEGGF